jgi:peptidoglycan hydrolase-like protein with peptidoglycan-binding domain
MIERPTISIGSQGSQVTLVQRLLGVRPLDGDFGNITADAVEVYQLMCDLVVDGVVGPQTWDALDAEFGLPPYPPPLLEPLDPATAAAIVGLARSSAIAHYEWADRGQAPPAYIAGMAIAFATCIRKLFAFDTSALDMAKANSHNEDKDALAWYADIFNDLEMSNETAGLKTLRHLFVLLLGLGMRESSGQHCEGRDQSATNVESETAEAGLFQQSFNSSSCSTEIEKLMAEYAAGLGIEPPAQCALHIFADGVECSETDWENYGAGEGRAFQKLCKCCPQFAVEAAAVALRHLRQHWGPINRREVEVRPEANDLFADVEALITAGIV